ncbi:MAG: hypothetical protein U1E65_13095 [Myxococcota bacterium]
MRILGPSPRAAGLSAALLVAALGSACVPFAEDADGGLVTDGAAPLDASEAPDAGPPDVFHSAPHAPFPELLRNSGTVLRPLRVIAVVAADDPLGDDLIAFTDALTHSSWLAASGASFGLDPSATSGHVKGPAIPAGTTVTRADFLSYIQGAIAGHYSPDGNTVFALFLPEGVTLELESGDLNTDCGYLYGYHLSYQDQGDAFALIQRCPPERFTTDLEFTTEIASHEIIEAATNPRLDGWSLPMVSDPPWSGSPWFPLPENADLCEHTRWSEGGHMYQRVLTNEAAQAGGDPCLPASPVPYYSVTASQAWFQGRAGRDVPIRLTGWSVSPVRSWSLQSTILARSQSGFRASVRSSSTTEIGGRTQQLIGNARTATLTVSIPGDAPSGSWVVTEVDSFRRTDSGLPEGEDLYHLWVIGVYVP